MITGVNGFAGRYLAPVLAEAGYELSGIVGHERAGTLPQDPPIELHTADLRQAAEVAGIVRDVAPTHIVHLAAISFVGHDDIAEIYDTNIVGTRNLLAAAASLPLTPQAVLLTSSANIYGNSTKGVLDEDEPPNPANDYAVSKIAMEYMARQFSGRLPITIARPFNYTGRGQAETFLVPKIVSHFKRRAARIELGNTDVSRDFSDVRTVVQYMHRLIETPSAAGAVFNICSGRPYSLQWIIDCCARITGHSLEVDAVPSLMRANEIKSLAGDPSRLHAAVDSLDIYSLEDTLAWMLAD
ncbi:MAG: GDP-mannose 4,6-dehydratase [Asticcacaulis sp.]